MATKQYENIFIERPSLGGQIYLYYTIDALEDDICEAIERWEGANGRSRFGYVRLNVHKDFIRHRQSITNFTRMREDGFLRRILPPVTVTR